MTTQPLHVALLWHMHQPYYQQGERGRYALPWVRLHGLKDYLDMLLVLEEFPDFHVTINLVPSLVEQILDYATGNGTDPFLEIGRKHASQLSDTEKFFLLDNFFHANTKNMIEPHARYNEIAKKRSQLRSQTDREHAVKKWKEADWRDLQVWFHLAWTDPLLRQRDPEISALVAQGRNFTEEQKASLLEIQRKILAQIIPAHREAQNRGQIEVSTTPYYHPILPLIIDTESARRALPNQPLPSRRFQHPDDAQEHVSSAVAQYESLFGRRPRGMWPSEGSVSPETIPLFASEKISWIASDQDVLAASLGRPSFERTSDGHLKDPAPVCQPYWVEYDHSRVAIFFREHLISDLIGFQYATWEPVRAAEDLVSRLMRIQKDLSGRDGPYVVSLILDGENCWEYYRDDGLPFLRAFYGEVLKHPELRPVTMSEALEKVPPRQTISRLHTGSWIYSNFHIWIGHEEDNAAWDRLSAARDAVMARSGQVEQESWNEARRRILIAEGSDWCWWYGDEHTSGMDDKFDELFRDHLAEAYRQVGLAAPPSLFQPIKRKSSAKVVQEADHPLAPTIDGKVTHYYEWQAAGSYDPALRGGSMHMADTRLRRLFFGFDKDNLFLRLDCDPNCACHEKVKETEVSVLIGNSDEWEITFSMSECRKGASSPIRVHRVGSKLPPGGGSDMGVSAMGSIIEIALPREQYRLLPRSDFTLQVVLRVSGREILRLPPREPVILRAPREGFEELLWII
ncbi:MAG: glycoside hydrolase family 57 protein [bacterium]